MVIAARRPPAPRRRLLVGPGFLLFGVAFLLAFRVALNVVDGNVIDVGYASVIGADRLAGGEPLYGAFPPDNAHGDTYGPVAYAAYVPFELLLPWGGSWDDLPAAHAAAVAFDLGCAGLLWLLGRRLRGGRSACCSPTSGSTFPFTLMVANSGANDALVALLVLGRAARGGRPAARGALVALAGLTKFAPLALAPLFAAYRPRRLLATAPPSPRSSRSRSRRSTSRMLWDRTLGFQAAARLAVLDLGPLRRCRTGCSSPRRLAAAAFAVARGVPAARRDRAPLAALAAAVLIALQLAVDHWFYLYLVWFAPLVLDRAAQPAPAAGSARSSPPAAAATPGSAPR